MTAAAPARKTLILHVGMGKTGTTALQNLFWANRDTLSRKGICYPKVGAVAGAHHLITPEIVPAVAYIGWTYLKPEEWMDTVLARPEPVILMSSELMASVTPDGVRRFCATLAEKFDLKVCVYLRRQDNMIMAGFNQQIKAGTQRGGVEAVLSRQIDRFDFVQRLAPWEDAVGAANMIVLPYEREQFHKGDLIDDFLLKVLRIDSRAGFQIPSDEKNANPRFSRAALEFKRLVNNVIPKPEESQVFNRPLFAFSEQTDASSTALFHEHDTLTPAQRREVLDRFAEGNALIARKFLGREDGRLFVAPVDLGAASETDEPAFAASMTAGLRAAADWIDAKTPELGEKLRAAVTAALAGTDAPATLDAARQLGAVLGMTGADGDGQGALPILVPGDRTRVALVHFGTHKTGTSSIQDALDVAELPPDTRFVKLIHANSSHVVRHAFMRIGKLNKMIGKSYPSLLRARFASRRTFRHGIAGVGQPRLILSAESIAHLDADEIHAMVGRLRATGREVRFVGYLRDPAAYLRSAFQEALKVKAETLTGPGGFARRLNHLELVTAIDEIVGRDRVHLFPYTPRRFPEGDVVAHFWNVVGLPDEGRPPRISTNESLSLLAVKMLFCFRHMLQPNDRVAGSPAGRRIFLSWLQDIGGPKFTLHPDLAEQMREKNRDFLDFAERRLGEPIPVEGGAVPEGITGDDDLRGFSAEETAMVRALIDRHGIAAPEGEGAAWVAEATARLRALAEDAARDAKGRAGPAAASRRPAAAAQAPHATTQGPAVALTAGPGEKVVVVHFGTSETGSRAIQDALAAASLPPGVGVVRLGPASGAIVVRNAFMAVGRLKRALGRPALMVHPSRQWARWQLRRAVSGPQEPTLILSADSVALLPPAGLRDMVALLRGTGREVRFVGYLRDPVGHAEAAFEEALKTRAATIDGPRGLVRKVNHHDLVSALDEAVGRQNVAVYPYDPKAFPDEDVVAHFGRALALPQGLRPAPVAADERLGLLGVKMLYAYRHLLQPNDTRVGTPKGREAFLGLLRLAGGGRFTLHPDLAARIRECNDGYLAWAARRLGAPLPEEGGISAEGIARDEDLMRFSDAELAAVAALLDRLGLPSPAGEGARWVAEATHLIRLHAERTPAPGA